jgi:hypothetical protein
MICPWAIESQRVAPPSPIRCDRNHLTSFIGKVISYRRQPKRISLRVRTDDATTESFEFGFDKVEEVMGQFLLRAETFKASDWSTIEVSSGKLHPGMRVIVWVCDDGSKPVFDWRPPER